MSRKKKKKSHVLASDAALVAEFLVRGARTKALGCGQQSYVNDYVYSILLNRFGVGDAALPKRNFSKRSGGYCRVGIDRDKELLPVPFDDKRDFVFSIYATDIFEAIESKFNECCGDELLNGFILSGFAVDAGCCGTDSESSEDAAVGSTALEWLDLFDELEGPALLAKVAEYIPDYIYGLHEAAWIDSDYLFLSMEDNDLSEEGIDESEVVIPSLSNMSWLEDSVEDVLKYARVAVCLRYGISVPKECSLEKEDINAFFERMKGLISETVEGVGEEERKEVCNLSFEVLSHCFYEMLDSGMGVRDRNSCMFVCHISSDLKLFKEVVQMDCGYPYLGQLQRLYDLLQNPSVSVYLDGEWKDMGEESYCKSFTTQTAEVFLYKCPRNGEEFSGTVQFPWFRLERTVFRILLDDYLNYIEYARHTRTKKEEVRDA